MAKKSKTTPATDEPDVTPVASEETPVAVGSPVEPKPGVDPTQLFKNSADVNKSRETQLLDVIDGIMSTDGMNVKTVLEDKHIVAIAKGLIFAERHGSKLMPKLIQILMEVRVSKGGRGRKDLVSAIKSSLSHTEETPEESEVRKRRLFG